MNSRQAESCRRRYIRFPADTLVWWCKDWETEPIALIDISAGGMLCEFPGEIPRGTKVSLHFEFPGHEGLIFCRCKVAHCRKGEDPFFLVGMRILELEGMDQGEFIRRLKNGLPPGQARDEDETPAP